MKELNELRNGLEDSRIMLVKDCGSYLECSFVKQGLVSNIVLVEDDILMDALRERVEGGIAEGIQLNTFRYEFESFALHVKAKKLYSELSFNLPMYLKPMPQEEEFEQRVDAAVA